MAASEAGRAVLALLVAEMALNVAVSALWAWGSLRAARRAGERPSPRSWRWAVVGWMGTKALLFAAILAELVGEPPLAALVAASAVFTVAHGWAFLSWLRLPSGSAAGRARR